MIIGSLLQRVILSALMLITLSVGLGLAPVTINQAWAVNPNEVLSDPVLEKRARALSAGLRCMVCQNQSIDDSDADLARDLRLLVRERLVKGDTNDQVLDYLVARYGEFVLLKPRLEARTMLLWGFPVLMLLCGIGFIWATRRKAAVSQPYIAPLTDAEKQRLERLLDGK